MSKDSIQGSPLAANAIPSQTQVSAAAAKAPDARLRKRPEDEVAADRAAATTDQQTLVAQAAPAAAAEGTAAAGGSAGAGAAGAAEGSASAGAGLPAVVAAAGGSSGVGAGVLAAGAVGGVALAGGGGGGGGGGGSTAAAPAPTATAPTPTTPTTPTVTPPVVTPPPPPPPPPATSGQIHNFPEYVTAINGGGATAATNATANPGNPTSSVDISGGFSRSSLPHTLTELRPSMTYNVANASVTTINDGGIAVDLQGNGDVFVVAHSNAAAGASNLMWMQRLAVTDQASTGIPVTQATSIADGAGSDAELGIQHVSMALAGIGAVNGRADLSATATGGGHAGTLVTDVIMSVNSSATGTSAAGVPAQIHMGFGEGEVAGILSSADGAGSVAAVGVGNVSLTARGDEVYAFNSGIFAHGTNGGQAATILGNVSFDSQGRDAHAYVLIDASTDGSAGSFGGVGVVGNVDLHSTGTDAALTRAAVRVEGTGMVDIQGHLNIVSDGPIANSSMQVVAQGTTSEASIDSVGMTLNGGGHGFMDLFTDHSGGLDIGTVNLTAVGGDITLHVQHDNTAFVTPTDQTFVAHADGTANVSIGTLNAGGAGEVHAFLNAQTFGTINEAASLTRLDVHYQLADQDHSGIGGSDAVASTTINGFRGELIYNGVAADATNFTNAGSFSSLGALNTGLNTALDGTHKYVFAVYSGAGDINGDGVSDAGSGVLAWDDNGVGMTSVVMLHGITNLTPADIT